MSDPPARSPGPAFPPDYPYGTPSVGSDPLSHEPPLHGSGSAGGGPGFAPPVWGGPVPPPAYRALTPQAAAVRARALAALIVSVLLLVPCLDLAVAPAIVLSAVALARCRRDLPLATVLVRVAWGWIVVSVVLAVAFVGWSLATFSAGTR